MKVPRSLALGSIRFSVGRYNTESEIDRVLSLLPEVGERLRRKGTFAAAI